MKRIYPVILLLTVPLFLFGQYDPRENFYDAEFFFAQEDYAEALYTFTKVYNDGYQDNANINYRIGVCLLNIDGKKTEAIPYLEKATENITDRYREGNFKEEAAPWDAYLNLGNAYRISHAFDKAIDSYKTYLELEEDDTPQTRYAEIQLAACERAKTAVTEEQPYDIGTLGQLNRIRAPIYNPVISGDLNTVSFMGRQKFYNGVYVSRNEDGKWTKPYNITPSIQSDGNQNVIALSYDGNTMLLAWYDEFDSDIWISRYDNDRWYRSEPLGKPVNSKFYESHACFSPDGNTIYFTSNRRESLGGMDIFRVDKNTEGEWGELILLGEQVNTPLNEENPFVSPDGKRLYFSSQGQPGGLGGFDIFYCEILDDGTYSKPHHLDYPLNTADDDFAFMPRMVEFEDYLTMYARGDEGQVELFRFEIIPEFAQPVEVAFETILEEPGPPEEVAEVVEEEAEEEVVEEEVVEEEVAEEPEPEHFMIRPVYFDFDSFSINPTAEEKLKGLATIMERFPNLRLEVIGHTDAVGTQDYNFILAQRRADAVKDYLVNLGVGADRFKTTSKGETENVARNRTPDNRDAPRGRALNRRVQFKVDVPGGVFIELKEVEVPEDLRIK